MCQSNKYLLFREFKLTGAGWDGGLKNPCFQNSLQKSEFIKNEKHVQKEKEAIKLSWNRKWKWTAHLPAAFMCAGHNSTCWPTANPFRYMVPPPG